MCFDPIVGFQHGDEREIACRSCKHAQKEHILLWNCEAYPEGKPDGVYFGNLPCPKFAKGKDLLPFETEI